MFNKSNQDDKGFEVSELAVKCHSSLIKLTNVKLFHFFNVDDESKIIKQMFKL